MASSTLICPASSAATAVQIGMSDKGVRFKIKGHDTATRVKHSFGLVKPEGYRKAVRLMDLADRYSLPVISFVDTGGAYPGIAAEERGQGEAIARSIERCLTLGVPMVALYHPAYLGRYLMPMGHPRCIALEHPATLSGALGDGGMELITVDQVWNAARRVMDA